MSPTVKSIVCSIPLAMITGVVLTFSWQQTAGCFAAGVAFVIGLIVFGRLFKVPPRADRAPTRT